MSSRRSGLVEGMGNKKERKKMEVWLKYFRGKRCHLVSMNVDA
jgi:hypothetical protein